VIIFDIYKCVGLGNIYQRGLEGNTRVGRMWESSSTIIPTISGTSFCGLGIDMFFSLRDII
jgi:hypothetical protein